MRELRERCRGVDVGVCSHTTEECDDNLFCHHTGLLEEGGGWRGDGSRGAIKRILTSPRVQSHYFCSYKDTLNTGEYENIDRSDESIGDTSRHTITRLSALLRNCTFYGYSGPSPGFYCGEECRLVHFFW